MPGERTRLQEWGVQGVELVAALEEAPSVLCLPLSLLPQAPVEVDETRARVCFQPLSEQVPHCAALPLDRHIRRIRLVLVPRGGLFQRFKTQPLFWHRAGRPGPRGPANFGVEFSILNFIQPLYIRSVLL